MRLFFECIWCLEDVKEFLEPVFRHFRSDTTHISSIFFLGGGRVVKELVRDTEYCLSFAVDGLLLL